MGYWTRRKVLKATALAGGAVLAGTTAKLMSGSGGNIRLPGRSRARPVATASVPPAAADVVIIGGGLIGISIAFNLARAGVSVAVCEKGAIAGEASGRSQGQVASAGLEPWKLDLINLSKGLWGALNEAVEGETGYRRPGLVCTFDSEEERQMWEGWLEETRGHGISARMLTADEANRLVPATTRWTGAFHDPTDGTAEPVLATPVIAEAAKRLGATLAAPCAVRGIEMQGGRVSHVVTEKGVIRTSTVILAGGCWSSLFAERMRLRLPSLNVFTTQVHVANVAGPQMTASLPSLDLRLQMDGSYTVAATAGRIALTPSVLRHLWDFRGVLLHPPWDVHASLSSYFVHEMKESRDWRLDEETPFERNRILEPANNEELRDRLLERAATEIPAFAHGTVKEVWSGALVVLPDNVPVMGAVPSVPGMYLATGFTYGLTMGPAAGLLVSQLVTGKKPAIDLRPYRYERFVDGSKLELTR